jgi:hypothetical protein
MRGVVESDRFHATPAVFHLTHPGKRIEVPSNAPLVEMFPLPRALAAAGITLTRVGAGVEGALS